MKERLNKELISAVAGYLPDGESMVNMLSEILSMGKESVYRRLRGDVLFTFDEVVQISRKLNLSLDNVIGLRNVKRAVFDLILFQSAEPSEKYYELLENYVRVIQDLKKDPDAKIRMAFNLLPHMFCLRYEHLSKFRLFKWANQFPNQQPLNAFSSMEVPQKILELQKKFIEEVSCIGSTHIVLDDHVFSSFVKDMHYFFQLKLITQEELTQLKRELLQLLSDLEMVAIRGCYKNGNEVLLYLSQSDIKTSYTYFESKDYLLCDLRLYSVNDISSYNVQVCRIQKEWIESLKRYSTLITQSGEIQRADYLDRQRKLIMSI